VGAYLLQLMDMENGQVRGAQVVGASVNYSPEFNASEPNWGPAPADRREQWRAGVESALAKDNPFCTTGEKPIKRASFGKRCSNWPSCCSLATWAVRRVQWGREEWQRGARVLRRWCVFLEKHAASGGKPKNRWRLCWRAGIRFARHKLLPTPNADPNCFNPRNRRPRRP
jgi:hypothetical protein